MSSINFRLYGDQIYGFGNKYITEYISPEIAKEDFLSKFESGKLSYENISTKKIIPISKQISLDELNIEKIDINIPNETENLYIYLKNVKSLVSLSEISEEEIENIIINKRKDLIDKFIGFVIKTIEKKESSKSFIEGLIDSFITRAINGLKLDFYNFEFALKFKNKKFIFMIEEMSYSEENGVKFNNVSLTLEEEKESNNININVINNFSINIEIIPCDKNEKKENEENNVADNNNEDNIIEANNELNKSNLDNKKNKLDIKMSDFVFLLNQDVFNAINDIYYLFSSTEYKKIYVRYKKLIQFHRPKEDIGISECPEENENNKNIYLSKFYYAIRTVLKLQKYIGYKKEYIFDLIESSQIKIVKKYLENNSDTSKIIIPTEINLLKATKDKVEQKLLDNKKGGGLTKAFSFFFGGGDDDDKKELSEEEKEELDKIYTDDYIIKYLLGLLENTKDKSNPLSDKIKAFMNNVVVTINIEKIELVLKNINDKTCNFFVKGINITFNLEKGQKDYEINIDDIGTEMNNSLFSERTDNNYLIQLKKEPNNEKIKLNIGFKNIILNGEILIFILNYILSLNIPKNIKLFHDINYSSKINKNEEENNNNNQDSIKQFNFIDDFSTSNIPSLILLNNDGNKLEFNLKNYSISKNNLNFTIDIQDSEGSILDNYTFNFIREENGDKQIMKLYLEEALKIVLSKSSSFYIFSTFLQIILFLKKLKKKENNQQSNNEEHLFYFNYKEYKSIDFDFNNISLDISINEISFEINEINCSSSLSIKKLILKYDNKDLFFTTEKIEINFDYLSTIILYFFNLKTNDFDNYKKKAEEGIDNDYRRNSFVLQNASEANNNYNITSNYIMKISDILNTLNLKIDSVTLSLKIKENTIITNISEIKGNKITEKPDEINLSLNKINVSIDTNNNLQEKFNVLNLVPFQDNQDQNMKDPILIDYYLNQNSIKVKIFYPILNIFKSIFIKIFQDLQNLKSINQVTSKKTEDSKLEFEIEIIESKIIFSIFKILIDNIHLKNDNTFYLTINNFLMKNEKEIHILEQDKLIFNFTSIPKPKKNHLYLKSDSFKINISQNDISFFISLIGLKDKNEEENINDNMNLIYNKNDDSLLLVDEDNNKESILYAKDINKSSSNKENKGTKKKEIENMTLELESEIQSINIVFCLDDYTKKSSFHLGNIILNLKNEVKKNPDTSSFDKSLEFKFLINRILLKYFDDYNNEINILKYQEQNLNLNKDKSNQIEAICNKEKKLIAININNNEVIIRIDCFLFLYYFFMNALPFEEPVNDNDNNKNNFSNVINSNENIIIKKKNNTNDINNDDDLLHIQINLNKTKLQLQTSFDTKENLNVIINDFRVVYNPLENNDIHTNISNPDFSQKGQFPINVNIKLRSISAFIISEKKSRELFNSKKEFINISFGINGKIIDIVSNMGIFSIKISYKDIISFLKVYSFNKFLIEKSNSLKNIQPQNKIRNSLINLEGKIAENKNSSIISVKLHFSKIDFTLIDNSFESYQPFLNGCINEISLNYSHTKKVECNFNFLLSSYNYIACKWEPIIENLLIKLKYLFNSENKNSNNDISVDINKLIMNLSDMAITSTLIILQHWMQQLSKDEINYSTIKIINNNNNNNNNDNNMIQINNNLNKKDKISNNVVFNYTGMDLIIKYNGNDFRCQQQSKLELNYINDWDASKFGPKNISVSINDRNNFNINDNKFIIFIDKLGVYEHYIDNKFLIAENTLSKNRTINISIYSQIIIKNKTFDKLQIKLINEELGNTCFLLESNSIIGIPFNYYHDLTYFKINPISNNNIDEQNQNNKFKLKGFLEEYQANDFCEPFYYKNKVFYVKLISNLNNLKEILITYQYRIINCLPCDIIIENQKESKSLTVKKFSQQFIDFYSGLETELIFKIKVGNEYFSSVKTKYFDIAKKKRTSEDYHTVFYNSNKSESFKLLLQYKKTKNKSSLIIFAESILYNDSGIDFNITSKNGNSPLCFNIGKNLYLLSSQIEDIKKVWIKLKNEKFESKEISLNKIIEANPVYKLNLKNKEYILKLIIKTSISYISIRNNPNFKKNIMTMIYKIYSTYRITNLLTSKNVVIAEENSNNKIIVGILKEVNFNFFGKENNIPLSLGLLNENNNKCSPFIECKFSSYGIFSYCIEKTLFNIEIKDSSISGVIDVFIVETNFNNAKILIENLSDIDFTVNQKGYEPYLQTILKYSKEILHIYGPNNDFIVRNNKTRKSYKFSFNLSKEEEYIKEFDDILFIKESNGMQMKFIIMNKNNFKKISNTITKTNLKIIIENILLSVIGDNEFKDRKLRNYERNEIFLLNLSKFTLVYNLDHCSSFVDKDKIKMSISLGNFSLYNQISKYGKFSCVCKNLSPPMINMKTEISNNSSMSKINNFVFIISKLKLNVDPEFIIELINFFENILYRMNIINFNVDDIFLHNNRDYKIKKLSENYRKENSICYGTNISFPEIDINFDVTEIGLGKLLYEKANCSDFFIWLGYGLVGKEQNLFLDKPIIYSYLGSLGNLIQKISIIYKEQLSSEITNIGLKGLWGQIQHLFINIDKTDKNCVEVQKNRIRRPRALYGKYKYFKPFDNDDAVYFDILKNKYHLEENGIYCCDLVKGSNYLYLFTNLDLIVFYIGDYKDIAKINYSSIIKVTKEKNNIIIFLNEGKNISICCESVSLAENVSKILSDKQTKNNE